MSGVKLKPEHYRLGRVLNEGLVGLDHWRYGRALWTRVKTRGHAKRCVVCAKDFPKKTVMYSPATYGLNRFHRICEPCMAKIVSGEKLK